MLLRVALTCVAAVACAAPALAQNWSFDARSIALGGVGGGSDGATATPLRDTSDYRAIVIPLGLIQVLRDLDRIRPDSDEFDLGLTVEYAAAPLHYVFGRDAESASGRDFLVDIRRATLSRDLSDYRGFELSNQPAAEGLTAPNWGRVIRLVGEEDGPSQGIYIGAGPYLSMRTESSIDQKLIDVFASEQPLRFGNDTFALGNTTQGQFAVAITGGWRGRFAAGDTFDGSGIHAALNYHYLQGLRYERADSSLRLDSDAAGLLTVNPLFPFAPLRVSHTSDTWGRGFAIDAALSVLMNGWQVGGAVNGIANRITWRGAERVLYELGNPFAGRDFVDRGRNQAGDIRVELPVDYRLHGGYRNETWAGLVEYAHGFQDDSFRGGIEYRLGFVDLRGGVRYVREMWQPTGGLGINMGPRVGLDLALFGTSANVARERRTALAVSLRLHRAP